MFVRAYLRASTAGQNANRALAALKAFAADHDLTIAATYRENESGTQRQRPELMRLLDDAQAGDVLLIESIDRLTRLASHEWHQLRTQIDSQGLRIVAVDLPTSHIGLRDTAGDEFTARMLHAINSMMLDMMAAIARKDYEQRRSRQAEGIDRAKAQGKYRGRRPDHDKQRRIISALNRGCGIRETARIVGVSTTTVQRVRRERQF